MAAREQVESMGVMTAAHLEAANGPRLLADIGGTNARFAWQCHPSAPIGDALILPCAAHPTLVAAMGHYLNAVGRSAPAHCAIAIANPVSGDQVSMTNHHWSFSIRALQAHFGFKVLRVLNDFTALALAIPTLMPAELRQVAGGQPAASLAIGLLGPGTGLGVSGLLPDGRGRWVPLQGEGGHVPLSACTAREHAVLQWFQTRYRHPSAERAVCGQGLSDIHGALQELDGVLHSVERDPAQVVAAALARADPRACEAVDLFCGFLGTVAGNLALTLGARGGIYIGGGIVPRLGDAFDRSPFQQRFESRGRFTPYLAEIPVYVIRAELSPALRGASLALALDGV